MSASFDTLPSASGPSAFCAWPGEREAVAMSNPQQTLSTTAGVVLMVNNMIVETLNPSSIIAQAYMATASLSEDEKQRFIREYNQHALENDIYTKLQELIGKWSA